jgi:hypothetical protein
MHLSYKSRNIVSVNFSCALPNPPPPTQANLRRFLTAPAEMLYVLLRKTLFMFYRYFYICSFSGSTTYFVNNFDHTDNDCPIQRKFMILS